MFQIIRLFEIGVTRLAYDEKNWTFYSLKYKSIILNGSRERIDSQF